MTFLTSLVWNKKNRALRVVSFISLSTNGDFLTRIFKWNARARYIHVNWVDKFLEAPESALSFIISRKLASFPRFVHFNHFLISCRPSSTSFPARSSSILTCGGHTVHVTRTTVATTATPLFSMHLTRAARVIHFQKGVNEIFLTKFVCERLSKRQICD